MHSDYTEGGATQLNYVGAERAKDPRYANSVADHDYDAGKMLSMIREQQRVTDALLTELIGKLRPVMRDVPERQAKDGGADRIPATQLESDIRMVALGEAALQASIMRLIDAVVV